MASVTTAPARAPWLARRPWAAFVARRLGRLAVSLLLLVSASFAMIHLVPGDPVRAALGLTAPADLVEARRHSLGLDRPIWQQYAHYLRGLASGDLGRSTGSDLPVAQVIGDRLPETAKLAVLAFGVVMLVSIPLGVGMAVLTQGGRRRGTELGFTAVTGVFAVVPEFLVAVGLVVVFAVGLKLLPVAGRAGPVSYVLPVLALAAGPTAALARIVRVEALTVLATDYMRTARAKRLPPRLLYLRHALPNLLTSALTIGGLLLTGLIAGSVLVETVFAWPGLGATIVQSILAKDYPLVQGIVLVYGTAVLLVNLLVDVVLGMLDPRSTIRES
jgi:peptide/nickel transport system permease protein